MKQQQHVVRVGGKFMLILQRDAAGIKLRREDGSLWEAYDSKESCEILYDQMDQLDEIEVEDLIRGTGMTPATFRENCGPRKECSFCLKSNERSIRIAASELLCSDAYSQIVEGACVPVLVAAEQDDDEMTADLFIRYKHPRRDDHDYDLTLNTSIRLTLNRVPEYK